MKTLELTLKGRDSFGRPVYESKGHLYCDVDPRAQMPPSIHKKADNEFDGEPDWPVDKDIEVKFIPVRDVW